MFQIISVKDKVRHFCIKRDTFEALLIFALMCKYAKKLQFQEFNLRKMSFLLMLLSFAFYLNNIYVSYSKIFLTFIELLKNSLPLLIVI